jgi:hypothetical protein
LWPLRKSATYGSAAAIPRASGSYASSASSGLSQPDDAVGEPREPRDLLAEELRTPITAAASHPVAVRRALEEALAR